MTLVSCTTSYLPKSSSGAEVRRYVEDAARLVAARGIGACEAFRTAQWRGGDFYLFVINAETHVTVCHDRPEIVGRNDYDLQDADGKYFMREMRAVAEERAAGGWVDYMWPRVAGGVPARKSTFVIGVRAPDGTAYVVGSGGYGLAHD